MFLAVINPRAEEVTKVRFSIGSEARDTGLYTLASQSSFRHVRPASVQSSARPSSTTWFIAHDTMSSQLLHARQLTVGTCEIRVRSPAPAAKQMSRAASRSTHTLPTHARSITTRRSQYPVCKKPVLRSQPLPAPFWARAPAYASIRTLAVVITESGDVHGQEQQGV